LYGTQPRGVSELREPEQAETSSARAEEFAEAMKELHTEVKQRLQKRIKSTSAEPIREEDSFSLKLEIWFWHT
jgi:ATP-dependent helicase/DNAse subunit B